MKRIVLLVAAALCCVTEAQAQTSSPTPAPPLVAAFGTIPEFSGPRLSPDGEHMAAVQVLNGHPAVVIYKTDAPPGTKPVVLDYQKWVVTGVRWVKNNALLVYLKESENLYSREYTLGTTDLFDADGKNGRQLPPLQLADNNLDDPDHFLALSGRGISLVDADTGHIHARKVGPDDMRRLKEFITDGHGNVVAWVQHGDVSKTDTAVCGQRQR